MSSGQKRFVRNNLLLSGSILAFLLYVGNQRRLERRARHRTKEEEREELAARTAVDHQREKAKKKHKVKPGVNAKFLSDFSSLLKIMVPSIYSPEAGYSSLVAALLILRTFLDIWNIDNTTKVERAIIMRDATNYKWNVLRLASLMLPMAVVNQLLKYGLDEMRLRFRDRLTRYLSTEYMRGFVFYQLSNLDSRIDNADQLLCNDVERFSNSVSELYSNLSKPVLDIILYATRLSMSIGKQGPLTMLAYLAVTGTFLTALRKPLSRLTVREQQLDGEWRYVNGRVITNAEEIAFYQGGKKEKGIMNAVFDRVVAQTRKGLEFRFSMGVVDNVVAKYAATVVGFYCMNAGFSARSVDNVDTDVEEYYKSGRMLMNMAMSVGRLVLAGRELSRLAGFTARVVELREVLQDLNSGHFERAQVRSVAAIDGSDAADAAAAADAASSQPPLPLPVPGAGTIIESDDVIKFDRVPLVTPNGDVLVRELSFSVPRDTNTFVAGPNGAGKSSLFRVLGELWPLYGGTLTKPTQDKLAYVAQRPYTVLGTLRDQILYPHSLDEARAAGVTDTDLLDILRIVKLEYLVEREGGFDVVNDWMDVLSGGEKQRIACARVFYHRPSYAILDECTSAVSFDVEADIYNKCRELNICLFTISHRTSLLRFHEKVLLIVGDGTYRFMRVDEYREYVAESMKLEY